MSEEPVHFYTQGLQMAVMNYLEEKDPVRFQKLLRHERLLEREIERVEVRVLQVAERAVLNNHLDPREALEEATKLVLQSNEGW
jgi:hypothetical protein